jgi:hypothetical protein
MFRGNNVSVVKARVCPCRNRVNARAVPESMDFVSRQSGTSSRRAQLSGGERTNRLIADATAARLFRAGPRKRGLPRPGVQVKFNPGG